jgi:hypothetical protein
VDVGELGGRPIAVSGGNDNSVRVWDLDAEELAYEPLVGHDGNVLAVAMGSLGDRPIAVSASDDCTVRVWDLEAGKPLGRPLEGHDDIVNAVAVGEFHGRPIAVSGGCDQLVRVWDLDTREPLGGPLAGHQGWVLTVAVGELGGQPIAVSGGLDDTVRVWDLAAGGPLGGPLMLDGFVNAVAVGELHDRSLAASGDARETGRPVVATPVPNPGREAAITLGSRGVDQGGQSASRDGGRRAAAARGSAATTTKPRSRRGGLSVTTSLTVRTVPGMRVVLIGLMLLGVVLVGFGVKMLVDTRRFLATAEPAEGVVVRVDKRVERERVGSGDNAHWANVTRYYPFVEFRTAREQVAQFQADDGSLQVGDSVNLVYDPANPRHARLDKWGNRWAGPLAFWGAGIAILVISGAIYLLLRPWGQAA